MSVPTASNSSILGRPAERPAGAATVQARNKPAFRVRLDPRQIDYYDLREAPAGALKKAGIEAGVYWLPRPYEMPAVPGVNGVWCDVDAGWTIADVLAKGYPAPTEEERAAGMQILDAWVDVPREFCPPDVQPGAYLRSVALRGGGAYYHGPFSGLKVEDPREDAREEHDRVRQGCWLAWLIRTKQAAPASAAQAAGYLARQEARVAQLSETHGVTEADVSLTKARALLGLLKAAKVVRAD
jgi:hypothetical protein